MSSKQLLCDHMLNALELMVEEFAKVFSRVMPDRAPSRKVHNICYHLLRHASKLMSAFQTQEGTVEQFHVLDNGYKRRLVCIRKSVDQVLARAKCAWIQNSSAGRLAHWIMRARRRSARGSHRPTSRRRVRRGV